MIYDLYEIIEVDPPSYFYDLKHRLKIFFEDVNSPHRFASSLKSKP
jgi:hypothetical protein